MSDNNPVPIGLLAGSGKFPIAFVESARERSIPVIVVAHKGETDPAIEAIATQCVWISLGQMRKAIKVFLKYGVKEISFVGGIRRKNLFSHFRPDLITLKLLAQLPFRGDDAMLRAVASEIESYGMKIISPSEFLTDWVVKTGLLTKHPLSEKQREDALVGWKIANALGNLDIGQTVIVHRRLVVAVEALEGTDRVIERAGELGEKGAVVIKRPKPNQDKRFDLPAVGENTIAKMADCGLSALILEEGGALLLEPQKVVRMADQKGIVIEVFGKNSSNHDTPAQDSPHRNVFFK
jgi:DUF1009 family protein